MHIDRAYRQSHRLRDLRIVQIFHKSKNKNGALSLRKSSCRLPDCLDLFVHRSSVLRRNRSIHPMMDLVGVDTLRFFPELNTAAPRMTANQVDGDPHEPGIDAAVSTKRSTAPVSVPEAVLSQ